MSMIGVPNNLSLDTIDVYYEDTLQEYFDIQGLNYPISYGKHFFTISYKDAPTKLAQLKHNSKVDWIQIVKWPVNSFQVLHNDATSDQTTLSSICYLNDNYFGGQTFFEEGTVFTPKKRRMLFFDGMYYKHGVTMVHGEIRYTLATWYKQNEKIKF